jgi:dephospho-CoA kinase
MPESKKPLFVGLTGGIAAGKSTVLELLEKSGVPVLSADGAVHQIYADGDVIELVRERLGDETVVDGVVDRDAVAEAIFAEPESRSWLEQMIWPRVGQKIFDFKSHWEAAGDPPSMVVVEVPLLFEAGMDQAFDKTVAVIADRSTRVDRAEARGDVEIEGREERQMPIEEKAERADFVVENNSSLHDLRSAVDRLITDLTESS